MAPRRSSRTRASVEPPAPPSKRKRNEPVEVPDTDEEDVKPGPRTRRSSSIKPAPAKGRASTRSRKSLEEVQEEEEAEEPPPPAKKSRPSLETEGSEEEPEEAPKGRSRKPSSKASAAAAATTTRKTRGSSVGVKAESSETTVPKRKTVASRGTRATRRVSTIVIDSDHEDPYEIDENGQAQKLELSHKAPAPAKGKRGAKKEKVVYVIDDSDDEPQAGPSRPTRRVKKEMTPVKEEVVQEEEVKQEEEEEEEEEQAEVKEEPPVGQAAPSENPEQGDAEEEGEEEEETAAAVLDDVEDAPRTPVEEEHSLLDPPLSSIPLQPSQIPPAPPAEPEGPKPRLVIHKMALVNFKSYAGRQEIGPFHKVRFRSMLLMRTT